MNALPTPMPGIDAVLANLHSASVLLNTTQNLWNKNKCWDNIRAAELYILMAKEKLNKL